MNKKWIKVSYGHARRRKTISLTGSQVELLKFLEGFRQIDVRSLAKGSTTVASLAGRGMIKVTVELTVTGRKVARQLRTGIDIELVEQPDLVDQLGLQLLAGE